MPLTFDSSRFGPLEVDADAVIEFPAGPHRARRLALRARADRPARAVRVAALRRRPDVALPVTNPWLHFGDYGVELSDADTARIGAEDPAEVDVWVTVRAAAELADFSCNLRAPIVVWKGRGHQVINEAPDAPVRAPLFPGATAAQAA